MTRVEIAAEKVRKAQAKREDEQRKAKEKDVALARDIRLAETQVREVQRKDTNKRRYHVGALADEAGLFGWSNAELAGLFQLLATMVPCPDPVAVLAGYLAEIPLSRN